LLDQIISLCRRVASINWITWGALQIVQFRKVSLLITASSQTRINFLQLNFLRQKIHLGMTYM
jgi:hypothetical protein